MVRPVLLKPPLMDRRRLPSGERIIFSGMSLVMATDWPAGVTPQPLGRSVSPGVRFWVWRTWAELTELVAERTAVDSAALAHAQMRQPRKTSFKTFKQYTA